MADEIERKLVIAKGAPGDARENGHGVIPRELVAREVEALALKRPASSRTRTATAPMSATATCASALVGASADASIPLASRSLMKSSFSMKPPGARIAPPTP